MSGERRRKRLRRYEYPGRWRFLTFSCRHRLPLLTNDRIASELLTSIRRAQANHEFGIGAWVFMPEHVHLLIRPTVAEVPVILQAIKAPFARRVISRWRRRGARVLHRLGHPPMFWQPGGGYDVNLDPEKPLDDTIDYIHQNPVRRGLVGDIREWRWTSARCFHSEETGPLPIAHEHMF